MHRGCYVWTPTPPLAGRRTPRPGPVRVCVCSSVLAGSAGPASRARSGAPHLFLWPLCLSAVLGPVRAGVASFLVLCPPSSPTIVFFSVVVLRLPPLSLAFFGFRPRVPWSLALCVVCFVGLALLGSPCLLASFVLPAWPLAALCWLPPPPPPFLSLAVSVAAARCLGFVFFSFLFLSAPPLSLAFSGFRPRVPWALALWFFFFCPLLLGCPCALACLCPLLGRWLPPPPPSLLCLAVFVAAARCLVFSFACLRPCCLWLSPVSSHGCPRPWRCVVFVLLGSPCALASFVCPAWPLAAPWWVLPPPPPFCVLQFSSLLLGALFFSFSLPVCAPVVSRFLWFLAPGALGLGAVCCLFSGPPASRLSVRSRLIRASRLAVGCSLVVAAPPPLLFLVVFVAAARCCVPCV